jgi:hypothetical protein
MFHKTRQAQPKMLQSTSMPRRQVKARSVHLTPV